MRASDTEEAALLARATEALRTVVDPEMGVNVVDLGLVWGLAWRGGVLELSYQLTSATCPIGGMMAQAMHDVLAALPEVMGVDMHLVEDPPWDVERISPAGRRALGMDAGA